MDAKKFSARLRKREPRAISTLGGILLAPLLLLYIATMPSGPITMPVSFTITDTYGGVYSSPSGCSPRPDYNWVNGPASVRAQDPSAIPPKDRGAIEPVIEVSAPTITRSAENECSYHFFVTFKAPDVSFFEQLNGAAKLPPSLGLYDLYFASEQIGTMNVTSRTVSPVALERTINVTKTIYGIASLGDLMASCTGGSDKYPLKWHCNGRVKTTGNWLTGFEYDDITKFDINLKSNTCKGRASYADFKRGAIVVVTGSNGSIVSKLVSPGEYVAEFPSDVPMANYAWYLYSKRSKVIVCHLAWRAENVPFSSSGYTIEVADRPPVVRTIEDLESTKWLVETRHGNPFPIE